MTALAYAVAGCVSGNYYHNYNLLEEDSCKSCGIAIMVLSWLSASIFNNQLVLMYITVACNNRKSGKRCFQVLCHMTESDVDEEADFRAEENVKKVRKE